jgi:hypothetical protein
MIHVPTVFLSALLLALPAVALAGDDHDHDHDHDEHQHADDDAHHQHGAHVHGTAWLDLALDGRSLELRLTGTGADLAGLEGAPADAADVAKVDAARRTLGDPAALFAFVPAGACTAAETAVTPPASALLAPGAGADAGHGDWSAEYRFDCATPPEALELRLFERFESLEAVQAQILTPTGQTAAELTPGARRIDMRTAD